MASISPEIPEPSESCRWTLGDYADCCAMFRHYASLIAATTRARAASDPNLPAVLEVCGRIQATALAKIEEVRGPLRV